MEGYIKLNRSLQNSWLWKDKPFSKGQAWIDLIFLAKYKNEKFPFKNKIISGERGTVYKSMTELSERWGWSRDRVRFFLNQLQDNESIQYTSTTHQTTIKLIKYSDFQDTPTTETATNPQPSHNQVTTNSQPTHISNKINKRNKGKKNNIYAQKNCACEFFDDLWKLYPRKRGKSAVSKKALQEINAVGFSKMSEAIANYKADIERSNTAEQYIMYGSTFFNGGYKDWLEVRSDGPEIYSDEYMASFGIEIAGREKPPMRRQ